jgi:hypothetical protein
MGFTVIGGTTGALAEVEAASLALRATVRPQDYGSLGAYAIGIDNGTTGVTAGAQTNQPIIAFRWGNSNLCLLRQIRLSVYNTTAFAAGRMDFAAFFARSYTVSDTGGTTATLTGANAKKRTSFGTTLLTELRFGTTGVLTAGTRTLDAQPFARLACNALGAAVNQSNFTANVLWQRDSEGEYPIVFAQNEGFIIQVTCPATGVWFWSANLEWAEVASF